jgi:hypothetical protein
MCAFHVYRDIDISSPSYSCFQILAISCLYKVYQLYSAITINCCYHLHTLHMCKNERLYFLLFGPERAYPQSDIKSHHYHCNPGDYKCHIIDEYLSYIKNWTTIYSFSLFLLLQYLDMFSLIVYFPIIPW